MVLPLGARKTLCRTPNFVGYLTGKELGAAFASADAFIFPSRTETLGLVLLEAMAAGCPVVAASSGGAILWLPGERIFV